MIDKVPNLPEQKRVVIEQLVEKLSRVAGMAALVLGGSYASGTQHEKSDIELGLYYYEARPFVIDEIRAIANEISVDGGPTITDFYGWGAWFNGGAWIHTPTLLTRNRNTAETLGTSSPRIRLRKSPPVRRLSQPFSRA